MTKIQLYVADFKKLYEIAKRNNKLETWADMAITWMEQADNEIATLKDKLDSNQVNKEH